MRILQMLAIAAALGTTAPFGTAQDSSSLSTLYSFMGGDDGLSPYAGVVIGQNGVLYGATYNGGISNQGVLFKLTPPALPGGVWTETPFWDFNGSTAGCPQGGLVVGNDGALYGTASGDPTHTAPYSNSRAGFRPSIPSPIKATEGILLQVW